MICWGIDPGVSGAICCFDYAEGAIDIFDMPIIEVRGKKKSARSLSAILSVIWLAQCL